VLSNFFEGGVGLLWLWEGFFGIRQYVFFVLFFGFFFFFFFV